MYMWYRKNAARNILSETCVGNASELTASETVYTYNTDSLAARDRDHGTVIRRGERADGTNENDNNNNNNKSWQRAGK